MAKKNKAISNISPIREPKRASIEKAGNGFVINKGYGDKPMVAKTLSEAQSIQAKFLK